MDKGLPDVLQALVIFVMAGFTHLGLFCARTRHKSATTSLNKSFTTIPKLNTLSVKEVTGILYSVFEGFIFPVHTVFLYCPSLSSMSSWMKVNHMSYIFHVAGTKMYMWFDV